MSTIRTTLRRKLPMGRALAPAGLVTVIAMLTLLPRWSGANPNAGSIHEPYRQRECTDCHLGDSGLVIRKPEGGLCAGTCHKDFLRLKPVLHGPLNVKNCRVCHEYHEAQHLTLLRFEPAQLCFQCHDEDTLTLRSHSAPEPHETCIGCHDPHGGPDYRFLRPAQPHAG